MFARADAQEVYHKGGIIILIFITNSTFNVPPFNF